MALYVYALTIILCSETESPHFTYIHWIIKTLIQLMSTISPWPIKTSTKVFPSMPLSLSLCSVCQSGLGNVRGSLGRRTDHKHTHMLSLSCASRPVSQTKPLRHIGNGTVMPTDFMHTIQIHTSQHCLSVRPVVLNWFSFRTQILLWWCQNCLLPLNLKPEPL